MNNNPSSSSTTSTGTTKAPSFHFTQCLLRFTLLVAVLSSVATGFAPRTATSHHYRNKSNTKLAFLNDEQDSTVVKDLLASMTTSGVMRTNNQSSSMMEQQPSLLTSNNALALPFWVGTPALLALAWQAMSTTITNPLVLPPAPSPVVVSEILTDASHVALDLITFLGPSAVVVRVAAVVGRLCSVLADVVPDGSMAPEEVVFQAFMLTVATAGLLQVWLPHVVSGLFLKSHPPTVRDGKAYKVWGAPAGMTWDQYKALTAVGALEWQELTPGETIATVSTTTRKQENNDDDDDDVTLYWLYKGELQVQRRDGKTPFVTHRRNAGTKDRLRQVEGAQHLDLATFQKTANNHNNTRNNNNNNNHNEATHITAGPDGATLLTCHMHRVTTLLHHDDTGLRDVFKGLLWQGLQDQLADAYCSGQRDDDEEAAELP